MSLDIRLVPDHFGQLPIYLQIIYDQENYLLQIASFTERIIVDYMVKIPQSEVFVYATNSYYVAKALEEASKGQPLF